MKRNLFIALSLLLIALSQYSSLPDFVSFPAAGAGSDLVPISATPSKPPGVASPRLPRLTVVGATFYADGHPVRLMGAAANHFLWNNVAWASFARFKQDVALLKEWGGNYVVVDYNGSFLNDPVYTHNLVAAVEYARGLALRVELVLHSHGQKDEDTPQQILSTGDVVGRDWERLLADPDRAEKIADAVDIFGILAEPRYNAAGMFLGWSEWLPLAEKTCLSIRRIIGRDSVCAISGTDKAANARGALTRKPTLENVSIEIHTYQGYEQMNPSARDWQVLTGQVMYHIGELGYGDDPGYLKTQLDYIRQNQLSFAGWAMLSSGDSRYMLDRQGRPTATGKIIREYFDPEP